MSYIQKAMDELLLTLATKNNDYRIDGEFSNFEFAADLADLEVHDVFLIQIAIKIGRLKGQLQGGYNHETYMDTVKDLAGYAVLFYAQQLGVANEGGKDTPAVPTEAEDSSHCCKDCWREYSAEEAW